MCFVSIFICAAKSVDDRSVPWSQREEESSAYENLASPTNEDSSSGIFTLLIHELQCVGE